MQEASAAKAQAEDRAAQLFAKKKTTAAERKMKKEQKDEAERHIAAQEALVGGCRGCCCYRTAARILPAMGTAPLQAYVAAACSTSSRRPVL